MQEEAISTAAVPTMQSSSSSHHVRQRRRQNRQSKTVNNEVIPPVVSCDNDAVDASSLGETTLKSRDFSQPYTPPPLVRQSTIMGFGIFVFLLGIIWPPLILLIAYVCSKLVPYSFRENDNASTRRELFHQFSEEEDLPDRFKNIEKYVNFEESFWVNERYVHIATTDVL